MDHGFALPGPARQALDLGTCGETEAHGTAYSRGSEGSSKSLRYTLDPVRCSVNQRRVQVQRGATIRGAAGGTQYDYGDHLWALERQEGGKRANRRGSSASGEESRRGKPVRILELLLVLDELHDEAIARPRGIPDLFHDPACLQ